MSSRNSTFSNQRKRQQPMSVGETSDILDQESPPNYITQRNKMDDGLRSDFKVFQDTIVSTLESWFSKQEGKSEKLLKEFEEIRKTLDFICGKYDELVIKTDTMSKRLDRLEMISVSDTEARRITELEAKIDFMDQQARQCNLEISNLPERRGEDLSSIVLEIGKLVKQPITQQDIISVHRVQHASSDSKQPKNVVVKLTSRIVRDKMLTSVRVAKGVTTGQLNIPGALHNVYLNEHLTMKTKKLFRETRVAARANGYKFTWVRNGTILVRENETSPAFSVRRPEDLQKIKRKHG